MYHIFCIRSLVEGHLGCFQFLAVINMAAMNIVEHVSLLHVGCFCGCQEVLADGGQTWLSSERLCQCLKKIEVETQSQPLD